MVLESAPAKSFILLRLNYNSCTTIDMILYFIVGKRGRYSHEKKAQVLSRIQTQSSDSNSPDSSTSSNEKDPMYISENEMDNRAKPPNFANREVQHPAGSIKSALSRDEMDNVVKKLVDMNRTLYRWTTEEHFLQDIESLCAQYLVNFVISIMFKLI